MDLIISLEATCDLTKQQIKQNDFQIIDMPFYIDHQEFSSKTQDVVTTKLYEKMKLGSTTSTSQLNANEYEEFFTSLINSNNLPILHIAFSSGLSKTYEQAKAAADKINKNEKKIFVIDSLCACAGQGLLAILVSQKAKDCNSIDEVLEFANNLKQKLCHLFTVDNLKHLASGGRIKPSTHLIGNILNIKPIMTVDQNGKLVAIKKVISRKKALLSLCEQIKNCHDPNFSHCIISHADCFSEATFLQSKLLEQTSLKPVITNLGPIIGCHSGPNTLAIFFLSK